MGLVFDFTKKTQFFSNKPSIGGNGGVNAGIVGPGGTKPVNPITGGGGATSGIVGPGGQKPNTITITLNDGTTKVVGTGYKNGPSSKLTTDNIQNTKVGNWDAVKANFQNGNRPSMQSIIQSLKGGK